MDIFLSLFETKKVNNKYYHTYCGKVHHVYPFRNSIAIFFEEQPKIAIYYENGIFMANKLKSGSLIFINYEEIYCLNQTTFFINTLELISNNINDNNDNNNDRLKVTCLNCSKKMSLQNFKQCPGKVYQPILDTVRCDYCNSQCPQNIFVGQQCKCIISRCKKCNILKSVTYND
jgi:hypothetical protein